MTRATIRPSKKPTTPFVARLRQQLRLPRKTFSRMTGFSERAIADWEAGKPVSGPALRRMREIERLRKNLALVVSENAIPEWLDTPNEAFDNLKPLELIERGEIDRLWKMIFYLESGIAV